jgi:uncharacterized protein YukE
MVDLDPAHGDTDEIRSAARHVRARAQCLVADRTTANNQAHITADGTWTGLAADAFASTMNGLSFTTIGVVDGWDRIATALESYAARLDELKQEASTAVTSYHRCEASVVRAQADLDHAEQQRAGSTYGVQGQLTNARLALARVEAELDELVSRRTSLDNEITQLLIEAPGPGFAGWRTLTTGPDGRRLQGQQLVDVVLDLLTDGTTTSADLDLVRQFLLTHGSDPEVLAQFYSALGAQGLIELENALVTAPVLTDDDARRTSEVLSMLANGLALASQSWSAPQCRQFGSDLIDTITSAEDSALVTVPALLSASGLDPQVGLGAMQRLDQIRIDDPALFDSIATERDPLTLFGDAALAAAAVGVNEVKDLASAIFGCLSAIPADALEFFGDATSEQSTERIDYWFYQRDWSITGFEAPTELLDAIIHAPRLSEGRLEPSPLTPWADVTGLVSRALEGLGANPHYTIESLSPTAAQNIISALTPYIPEIATRAANGKTDGATSWVFSGEGVNETITLDVNLGNLARLLGIAMTQETAQATYGQALNDWKGAVIEAINSGRYPVDSIHEALRSLGAAQGMAYSYGAELANHAGDVSEQHKNNLDLLFTLFSFAPQSSSGIKAVDYVGGVLAGNTQTLFETMDPTILTDDEISQITTSTRSEAERRANVAAVSSSKASDDTGRALDLPEKYIDHLGNQSPELIVGGSYDTVANATSQLDSSDQYNVVAPGGNPAQGWTRREMP